ncbi:MAG: LLM class flavin-dependent oxidoreductase [Roseiflexaceae bacterium]
MSERDKRIGALSPEQRRLLELRLKQRDRAAQGSSEVHSSQSTPTLPARVRSDALDFSLIFFSTDSDQQAAHKYRPIIEAARFADQHGFSAVWVPERHFHQFGGLYPSPAVLASALAMVTERIQIRAGSVVLPMHHPARVVEEWSMIDNLSNGRVGVSFASGWSPNDFVLRPEAYADRRERLFEAVATVRRLWGGEPLNAEDGQGQITTVQVHPRPVQPNLPIWISSTSSSDTCARAGALGANLLTALLRLSIDEVAEHIAAYRQALAEHGHDPRSGHVTLMLHTFLGTDLAQVKATVRQPLMNYLRTYLGVYEQMAAQLNLSSNLAALTEDDKDALVGFAFERYFTTSGLFGTPESCLVMLDRLQAIGVDEVACLIDFGVPTETMLEGLSHLATLRRLHQIRVGSQANQPERMPQ